MTKIGATMLTLIFCVSTMTPVMADQSPPSSTATKKSRAAGLAKMPLHLVGFCAGTVIGTPICALRKFPQEMNEGGHGFIGSITDSDNKLWLIPGGILWLPFAMVTSTMEAPFYALKNAWIAEQPFSKEQFSLGELDPPSTSQLPVNQPTNQK